MLLIVMLFLAVASGAAQAQSCVLGAATANPNTAKAASTLAQYQIFFTTRVTASFSCTGNSGQAVLFMGPVDFHNSVPIGVVGTTNIAVGNSAAPIAVGYQVGPARASIANTSGPCTAADQWNLTFITFTGTGTCTGNVTAFVSFHALTSGPVTGPIPAVMGITPAYPDFAGWISAKACVPQFGTCTFVSPTPPLAFTNLTAPIPVTSVADTCSLIGPANRVVSLPTVPLTAFQGVGSKAGNTLVKLQVNCPVAAATALNFQLLFYGAYTSNDTTLPNYLYNGASPPVAADIAIIVQDANGNQLSTGQVVTVTPSIASGVNTMILLVGYGQYGPAPTTGNVQGTATFAFTYN